MKKILLIFILILTTTTVFSFTKTDDWVDGAAEQIIYLKERNLSISKGDLKGNKWYIYFLGSNKQELSEIIDDRPSKKLYTFSSGYLKKINDLLIELNKSTKVAMYVALTDYDTPIRTPLIPSGSTLDEKVTNLQERIRSFSTADKLKGSKNDFIKAQKGYAAYQAFFNEKLELLYKKAKLNATGKKVYLPLLAAHYVHKYDKKILYGTYTVRYPDVGEQVKKEIKEIYEATFATIGKNSKEKSIERIVRACISQDKGDYDKIIKGGISTEIPKNSELGERAANNTITPSEVDFNINKNLLDFAGLLTEEEKQDFINSISFSRNILNGMTMRVLLTDSNTKQDILEEIEDLKPTDKEYFIWVHVNTLNTEYEVTVKNLTSEKTAQKIAFATAHWTERMWKNEELNLGKGSVAVLKANLVFTNMFLRFVSDTLKATQIPEKYWNPLHKEYPIYMESLVKGLAISTGNIGTAFDTDLAQKEFAFKCGLWNGLIDQFKGLADLGVLATDYLVDPEKAKAFDDNLNQLTIAKIWDSFKKAHGYEKDKETNYFKLSHQLGKDVITVASLFIGVGELSALAKTGKLSSTVALTKNIDKLSKAVKGGAIKIIKTSPKLAGLLKKLPKTIVAEVKKIGLKSYLILTVNKTKLAKISDDVVFSEMKLLQEGAIVKYTDGSDIVFNNAKYIDNGVEKTGTLSIVKSGDEVGVKLANAGGKSKIIKKLDVLGDLTHAKKFLNSLDDVADAKLLSRIDKLTDTQLQKLDELYDPKVFQRPGNRPIRNGKKADGDFTVKTRDGKHDIYFDKYGFADLKRFTLSNEFTYTGELIGNSKDFSEATKWLKNKFKDSPNIKIKRNNTNLDITINGKKKTYTWHHHQNGKELELVETAVHKEIAHTGGTAIITRYLQGLFE